MGLYAGVYPALSDKEGKFRIRINFTCNGRCFDETRTITAKNEKDAYRIRIQAINEMKERIKNGDTPSAKIFFDRLVEEWKENNTVSKSTYETYDCTIRKYIEPFFKGMYLSEISKGTIKNYEEYLRKSYSLSTKTLYNNLTCLRALLTYGVEKNWINENNHPFKGFKMPKDEIDDEAQEDNDEMFFDDKQLMALFNILDKEVEIIKNLNMTSNRYKLLESKGKIAEANRRRNLRLLSIMQRRAFVHIAVNTGARRGEIAALKWDQIDPVKNQIKFKGNTYFSSGTGNIKNERFKNKRKYKCVYVVQELIILLNDLRKLQDTVIKENDWEDNGFIFLSVDEGKIQAAGSAINSDIISEWFSKICIKYKDDLGLSDEQAKNAHFHMLRHSSLSFEINNGVNIETAIKKGDWRSDKVPRKVYEHIYDSSQKIAASKYSILYNKESTSE